MRKIILPAIANFLRDANFITFALFFAILYFTQLYTKLGYVVTSIAFDKGIVAWLSAFIFGLFAGTTNTALILNNKDNDKLMIRVLIGFDIAISLFFYGDSVIASYQNHWQNFGSALASLFLAVYAPFLVYFLAEHFRRENIAQDKFDAHIQADRLAVEALLARLSILPTDATAPLATLLELVATKYTALESGSSALADEANTLRPLQKLVATLQDSLATQSTEFDKARELLAQNQTTIRELKEAKEVLERELQDAKEAVGELRKGNELKSEKGTLTKFVKAGDEGRAKAKVVEIKQKFGVNLEIDWENKNVREVA